MKSPSLYAYDYVTSSLYCFSRGGTSLARRRSPRRPTEANRPAGDWVNPPCRPSRLWRFDLEGPDGSPEIEVYKVNSSRAATVNGPTLAPPCDAQAEPARFAFDSRLNDVWMLAPGC